MGVADTTTKEYMRGSKVFADAFNYFIYGGEKVVDPEFLHELDTTDRYTVYLGWEEYERGSSPEVS